MNRWLLVVMGLVGVGVGVGLSSCNFQPPSKPWKEVIDRDLVVEKIECSPEIPGPSGPNGPHCHLMVKPGANGHSEPTRKLRVTKPFGRNYSVSIFTPASDSATEGESAMSCSDLEEFGNGYELNGYCQMDFGSSSNAAHEHVFHAWMQPIQKDDVTKWRVDFEFIHDKLGPRHNGTGHTEAQ